MTTSGKEIDVSLRNALVEEIGEQRYQLWFEAKAQFCYRDRVLTCKTANSFYQDWLRANFRTAIEQAASAVFGEVVTVHFDVNAEFSGHQAVALPDRDAVATGSVAAQSTAPVATEEVTTEVADDRDAAPLATSTGRQAGRGKKGSPRGGDADGRPATGHERHFATFADFVVGHSNRVAEASACMVTENPGCLTPLVLHGDTGVGKTHLLESIWSGTLCQRPTARGLFLTAEQFTSLFLEALHHSGLPSFRRKYRNLEILMVDDIQFFGGKKATLGELLHTIEAMHRHGRQVVLTADRAPTELEGFPAELISRFSGGMVCKMLAPDLQMRKEIVRRHVLQREWALAENVQELVAGRMSESPRELFGAINRLHATELATNKPITLAAAEEALADLFLYRDRTVRLVDIEKAVCETFGLEPKSLRSSRKIKSIVQPRMLAMWLARKYTRRGLAEIGEYFGNRSHATVISAQKRVSGWMAGGDSVQLADYTCPVEDAIRRVESRMRA